MRRRCRLLLVVVAVARCDMDESLRRMRALFESRLSETSDFPHDNTYRNRTRKLVSEVRSLLAIDSVGDWIAAGVTYSNEDDYEHAVASFFRADSGNELHLASMFAAWGDFDDARLVYDGVVADALLRNDIAHATAVRFNSLISSIPPVVPSDPSMYRKSFKFELTKLVDSLVNANHAAVDETYLLRNIGRTVFHLAHQCINEVEDMQLLAKALRTASPGLLSAPTIENDATLASTTLRVGFVSAYLSDHSVGKMLAEVLAILSKKFYVAVFHLARSDDANDHVRAFIDRTVSYSTTLDDGPLSAARNSIASAHLDILVYPDIGMEPRSYFLAFSRLARIQCVWWGHPVTPGLDTIDYFLSLDTELHDADSHYGPEQLVRIDSVNTAPFTQILELQSVLERDAGGVPLLRDDLLDDALKGKYDGPLYLVLGRLFKLHPAFDQILLSILEEDSQGIILLVAESHNRPVTAKTWDRLKHSAGEKNASLLDRVNFIDYWNYVKALALADVVLDTYPYGGCLTALDALSNSKAFVTLPGPFERGRFAVSMLQQMNLTDLFVARNREHFVQLAVDFGNNATLRADAIATLQTRFSRAHRPKETAEEWASMFLRMNRTSS